VTLEEYLREAVAAGAIDFRIRAHAVNGPGLPGTPSARPVTTFYIHPAGKDGTTVDFAVNGNSLTTLSVSK
jgi:hypothetical protein